MSELIATAYSSDEERRRKNNTERTHSRDLHYSQWHRRVHGLAYVDIDSVESCPRCQQPICLVEFARDVGQDITKKRAHVTRNIANRLGIDAYVVLYKLDEREIDIAGFRAIRIAPKRSKEHAFTPAGWGEYLKRLQSEHQLVCKFAAAEKGGN